MFLDSSEYTQGCKIGSRCNVTETVKWIEKEFKEEAGWFRSHPQFKHIFHMPRVPNHMTQGMWMLMLRTVETDMVRECWFVVNGVPIRYSIKEHALLTGFNCKGYPEKHEKIGNEKFVKRIFRRTEKIKASDVLAKLKEK
ncbi:uncharacterized protein At3g43530-like [Arabidopsis lyrata subsp. lyrata]|uniref:uncharacterized protein At3g43530-like n=1 Tax=Arabidopsis lyrata subsp. lyrata TaxID=81972 RepID=UPI000A29D145|nr:uncharacterized protein At3g43530-like [Arabidopsis lyrata subsp. lyrata]|eukprot:XP_020876951.1 uncharacterized protein At3g43530-like [Arabidopsis lyrata subsp. lyrata]